MIDHKKIVEAERELEDLDAARERLYHAWVKATDDAREQTYLVRDLLIGKTRATIATMTVKELREHVADLARNHGSRCARLGKIEETEWGPFRVALAELARRLIAAADVAQEVAHKYEASALQDEDGVDYWRAKAEVAREIEKRLRGET